MKLISYKPPCNPSGRAGLMAAFLFSLCLPVLFSCGSSSSPPAVDARLNQHLAYQPPPGGDATLKPYQTAVLHLPARQNDHGGNALSAGYHEIPYEITNAGNYKYCIPDEDKHLTAVELYNPSGAPVAAWKKGEPCTYVPLDPGRYTMHVHLDTSDSDPPIFLKPHNVEVKQKGVVNAVGKIAASIRQAAIPDSQLLQLKVDSLSDIVSYNTSHQLQEGWGIATPYQGNSYPSLTSGGIPVGNDSKLSTDRLFYIKQQPDGNVSLSQGSYALGIFPNPEHLPTPFMPIYIPAQDLVGLVSSDSPQSGDKFIFEASGTNFKLSGTSGLAVAESERQGGGYVWGGGRVWAVSSEPAVDFQVEVRYGTFSAENQTYPALLANEVALCEGTLGPAGFPPRSHYWIIHADMQDFSKLSFDNPTNRIKTVIAGRGVRAQLFEKPSFQGASFYVSPPKDREMAMTSTDTTLLSNGTVGSIRIEENTNDITFNEYYYHMFASANTCIGCDLRGFDASNLIQWYYNEDTGESTLRMPEGINFRDSDLANSVFTKDTENRNTFISRGNFENVNFTGANLNYAWFDKCNLRRTDFTKAKLNNAGFNNADDAGFDNGDHAAFENPFYNSCPKFEFTDLTSLASLTGWSDDYTFDNAFYLRAYNANDWWNRQRNVCRTSLAHAKVSANLFSDKRLWQFVDAPGVDFSGMNLDGFNFAGSNLQEAIFKNASLRGTIFVTADLTGADLTGADLYQAHLEGAKLDGVDLHKAKTLQGAFLSGVTAKAPDLSNLDMSGATLKSGRYTNWDGHVFEDFAPASLNGAYMYNTKLNGADLSGAFLQGVSWYGDIATGENAIMAGTHFEHADLPGLNLKKAHLQGANFTDAVLVNADLSTVASLDYSFGDTTFYQANLKGTNLTGANLNQAALDEAFIYAGVGEQATTIEVLDNPTQYKYYQQSYSATKAPASTDGITTCPNGSRSSPGNNCGDSLTSEYWVTSAPPRQPTDCVQRKWKPGDPTPDDQGMVLVCTSQRHKK